jgi:hypothetical protein
MNRAPFTIRKDSSAARAHQVGGDKPVPGQGVLIAVAFDRNCSKFWFLESSDQGYKALAVVL